MEDVFAIQEEIAESVARALRLVLTEHDRDALQARRTSSLAAYELYLKARQILNSLRNLRMALPLLEKAIDLDPEFALAHATQAEVSHWLYAWFGARPEDLRRAEAASQRALALAPDLAEVHVARGAALALTRCFEEAAGEFNSAIYLNPQLWEAYWLFGRMRFAEGRHEDAERLWTQAMRVWPEDYQVPILLSMIYQEGGRTREVEAAQWKGIELARRQLARDPGDVRAMYLCAGALVDRGLREEGLALLGRAMELADQDPSVLYNAACVYAKCDEPEKALAALEGCVRVGWVNRHWMAQDTDFAAIRSQPRFQALLKEPPES
jgi:tetratricopeptide (TPR) repeat protein